MTLIVLGIGSMSILFHDPTEMGGFGWFSVLTFIAGGTLIGAGIANMFNYPWRGATAGTVVCALIYVLLSVAAPM